MSFLLVASVYFCTIALGEGGLTTASGQRCNPAALTVAHKTLPFGTPLTLCLGDRCVGVSVNDRGPFIKGRDLDLTPAVAKQLRFSGLGKVRVYFLLPKPRPQIVQLEAKNDAPLP